MPVLELDFNNIRAFNGDQRLGFEKLVCQLAKREPPVTDGEFRYVEGSGGDGGLEAYWLLPDGSEIGYQAKFFTRTGEIDWRQVDESVKQALDSHPKLKRYQISFACDLTDQSGKKGRGKRGWEHWDTHKEKWEERATERGMTVEFVAQTKSDICDLLIQEQNVGRAQYWFDIPVFNPAWFKKQFSKAKADLGERYHPKDHVDVACDGLFEGLTRSESFVRGLREKFDAISTEKLERRLQELEAQPDSKLMEDIRTKVAELRRCTEDLNCLIDAQYPIESWRQKAESLKTALEPLDKWISESQRADKSEQKSRTYGRTRLELAWDAVMALENQISEVVYRLEETPSRADLSRAGTLIGDAGTGKSHICANLVENCLRRNEPALMLLGQYFDSSDPWQVILRKCDLAHYRVEDFLSALDTAAETVGRRCVLVIDALNESQHLKIWQDHLAGMMSMLLDFKHLAIVVTCRPEYEQILIPEEVRTNFERARCLGFTTYDEIESAAIQYIEKRELVRPAVPWLAPDFTNPLFLRTCCEALQQQGAHEFPRGLTGTKQVLKFYFNMMTDRFKSKFPNAQIPSLGISKTMKSLAGRMAEDHQDYLSLENAQRCASKAMGCSGPSEGSQWIGVFLSEGILRKDHIFADSDDPLDAPEEVVRFSFQRFSDHLFVESLLKAVIDPKAAFKEEVKLGFLVKNGKIRWEYTNLLEALGVQLAEGFQIELLDALPETSDPWYDDNALREAFWESLLWRSGDAFTDRTLELFNVGATDEDYRLPILLQLAVLEDHPWNADFLHDYLSKQSMPNRDTYWSVELASSTGEREYPIHRLIEWTLRANLHSAGDKTLRLAGIILTWSLATPSRPIRDKATKALTRIIHTRCKLFSGFLEQFREVDDLYILERLIAASYGAACTGLNNEELSSMAEEVYTTVFEDGSPPLHPLLRDYALGIVEKAERQGCLPTTVDLERCCPPYRSDWPLDDVSKEELEAIVKSAGDRGIYSSVVQSMNDFSNYEINHRFRAFSPVALSDEPPLNKEERWAKFSEILTSWEASKREAFEEFHDAAKRKAASDLQRAIGETGGLLDSPEAVNDSVSAEDSGTILDRSESEFLELLVPDELSTFQQLDIARHVRSGGRGEEFQSLDLESAKLWIAKRAYGFGWSSELFPHDTGEYDGRNRPTVERVGKKYQWLAFFELFARLTDNVWMTESYPGKAVRYENTSQLDGLRDIDPSVLESPKKETSLDAEITWWFPRDVEYHDGSDEELVTWVQSDQDLINSEAVIDVLDVNGASWLVLNSFYNKYERFAKRESSSPFRRQAWVRVSSVVIHRSTRSQFFSALRDKVLTDPDTWNPPETDCDAFYLEYLWRTLGDEGPSENYRPFGVLEGLEFKRPTVSHYWGEYSDKSLQHGCNIFMPSQWLAEAMDLRARPEHYGEFLDSNSRLAFQDPSIGTNQESAALVARESFLERLESLDMECLWIVAGEKDATPSGSWDVWARRTHGGVYWVENGCWEGSHWVRDESRGLEAD